MARPTPWGAIVFELKATVLRGERAVRDRLDGVRALPKKSDRGLCRVVAESRTPLWIERVPAERALEQGKVQNLRAAARRLDGTRIPAGEVFSFWKQVGAPTRARGFAVGRMIKEGCVVPSSGGGLCQLSNALYEVASRAGLEILERHRHSRVLPGSAAERGHDATVAYNYVDLRFRAREPLALRVTLTSAELVVQLLGRGERPSASILVEAPRPQALGGSCTTCDIVDCVRKRDVPAPRRAGRTAFLVDARWPEHEAWILDRRGADDVLLAPLDGVRLGIARYAWSLRDFPRAETVPAPAIARALAVRTLAHRGSARLAAELHMTEAVAIAMARLLTPDVEHLCVAQTLLPFLWASGALGGRTFDVLATRLPLHALHARLDEAARAHPARASLTEFRAPRWIADAERDALASASRVITPHAEVARVLGARPLPWHRPARTFHRAGDAILFLGPTAARKGAYEVRELARALDLEVRLAGSELEGADFWRGVRTRRSGADWLDGVRAVVHPALVEEQPRALLRALAAGVPVLATRACGLESASYVEIPYGDETSLHRAFVRLADRGRAVAQLRAEITP